MGSFFSCCLVDYLLVAICLALPISDLLDGPRIAVMNRSVCIYIWMHIVTACRRCPMLIRAGALKL